MFNIFQVSARSWHMVSEVLSPGAKRLSINGWFHADDVVPSPQPTVALLPMLKPHMDITYEEVMQWINPVYIVPEEQARVRRLFGKRSEIDLTHFIQKEKYDEVLQSLGTCEFELVGPLSRRQVWCLREDGIAQESCVSSLLRLFRSRAITLLLSQWTGLALHPLMEEDAGQTANETDGGEAPNTKRAKLEEEIGAKELSGGGFKDISCTVALKRFSRGCYTMVDDQLALEADKNGYCLDLQLFFGAEDWDENAGGFISYVAKDEENEVLRVGPVSNSAALVYREPDVFPFVRYVNDRAKDQLFYVLNCSFFGVHPGEGGSSDGDSSLEETDEDEECGGTEVMEEDDRQVHHDEAAGDGRSGPVNENTKSD
ncbi:2-oxoglutarate and iron-dependent oxygenase domain-containing protein 1 [Toxocara canis]|uniref:2-oxoglutarate and iron-dependent oxygenase domain-containing protein 1 n=1 Tax=Toxocara canis TaxID=6265 RepID=A0A0B2VBW5_TOXCA|nr:2-oxoglutarate and iron-dependent oxygenase domain-containing protein 1 [Toxocara canis]